MLNNERIENDIRISKEFNNYFVSVGSTLASKINDNSCNPLDYIQSNVQSMAIPNYNENDVTLAINSLKNSSGWDNIPTLIAKHVIHCYIKLLVFLINQYLIEGVFPDELKLAKVIPVYKAGSSMELSNDRPIPVLIFFSKVYEKLMYNSLVSYFDKYNILYQNKFGFRQGHSSHHALITLVNKITQSLDSGDMVIGIFLDLKKAFDTVIHNILV